jgi:hypothetical protein
LRKVFVLDTNQQPLDPVHPGRARQLLSTRQAAVFRHYPFTLILKQKVTGPGTQPLRLKLDPGSKTTGMAIVNDQSGEVVFADELRHSGQQIKHALNARRAVRRSRRQRKTRYRARGSTTGDGGRAGWHRRLRAGLPMCSPGPGA